MGARISTVEQGSMADRKGIRPGWRLDQINGEDFADILEYRFLCCSERVALSLTTDTGQQKRVIICNDYEDIGIGFENPLIDRPRSCRNKCIFCFIDQLPKGMRDTLYFKDDDSRLSFLHGNYITLTNMTERDLQGIVKTRISPINISVHTTNPVLRVKMLNNRFAGDILDKMCYLAENTITMNCQIVCCKGINDGEELSKTVRDLAALYPYVNSISAVPVGLSRYREGLYPLEAYEKEDCLTLLDRVDKLQQELLACIGTRLIYAADEFYLKAGRELPNFDSYEGFPQIENGVGMISSMREEFYDGLAGLSKEPCNKKLSIVTGTAAAPEFGRYAAALEALRPGLTITVYAVKNDFFGHGVNVAGLLTAGDILHQTKGHDLGQAVLISQNMLKADEAVFLDDITLKTFEQRLGVPVICVGDNGYDLINTIENL